MFWIKATESLPEDKMWVIVFAHIPGKEPSPMTIGRYLHNEKRWELMDEDHEENAIVCGDMLWTLHPQDITHWQPMPEPIKI